jgi:hypothetical protein
LKTDCRSMADIWDAAGGAAYQREADNAIRGR